MTQDELEQILDGNMPHGLQADEEVALRTARLLLDVGRLTDAEYTEAVSALGAEVLAAVVWLVGYYSMLAMSLAMFRPKLPDLEGP